MMFLCLGSYFFFVFFDRCVHFLLFFVGFFFVFKDSDIVLLTLIPSRLVYFLLVFEVFSHNRCNLLFLLFDLCFSILFVF